LQQLSKKKENSKRQKEGLERKKYGHRFNKL